MSTGYSRAPRLVKGALVEFSERFLGPIPNVIIFQYNPESMTRTLEVWSPDGGTAQSGITEKLVEGRALLDEKIGQEKGLLHLKKAS